MKRIGTPRRLGAAAVVAGIVAMLAVGLYAQDQFSVYLFVMDKDGVPVLDVKASEIRIKEAAGPSEIVRVSRVGWPLKLTVLVDNGPGTADALVHMRSGLNKFFEGLPRDIPVSFITTAPNPRWLIRESKDPVQIAAAVSRLTPDESLGRFSDALSEYADRLDVEFRRVEPNHLPPYLPVLVSIATTHADGSNVIRERNEKMLRLLNKHRVWTNLIMVTPARRANDPGSVNLDFDEGQNAEIAKLVQEVTRGRYVPVTSAGTSALSTKLLPELAQEVTLRYLKQMTQHKIDIERAPGASGPMKDFALSLLNRPGAKILVSTDGSMP
jgi:hypothetical protein